MDLNGNNTPNRGRYPYPNNKDDKHDKYYDPRFKRILWFLFASTRGGSSRIKIISLIKEMPANANQISTNLNLNYKTIIHHLNVLIQNGLIITDNKGIYGSTYFLTSLMEQNFLLFKEIIDKIKIK